MTVGIIVSILVALAVALLIGIALGIVAGLGTVRQMLPSARFVKRGIWGTKFLEKWERGIVFRFGHAGRVVGPGLVFHIPLMEVIRLVDLETTIPGWRTMPESELKGYVGLIGRAYDEIPEHLSQLSPHEFRGEMRELEARLEAKLEGRAKAISLARAGQTEDAIKTLCESHGIDREAALELLERLTGNVPLPW